MKSGPAGGAADVELRYRLLKRGVLRPLSTRLVVQESAVSSPVGVQGPREVASDVFQPGVRDLIPGKQAGHCTLNSTMGSSTHQA